MPFSFEVSGAEKDQLVVSLAALLLHDCGAEMSADNLSSVVNASGNSVAAYFPTLFATYIEKAGGVDKFLVGPSAGGAAPSGMCFFFLVFV
jgi:ribosomal protein L12E/L44/L45/RPP1/RPP2